MIIIQAGHYGRTSGSTGAPGEANFNWDVANQVSTRLSKLIETKVVKADPSSSELTGDHQLFLAIHYDADIYGTGGYFVDFPEPSTDCATLESQRISKVLSDTYKETGIVNHLERSNKNTKFYYMWSQLSAKTPCVLIECGVGQHKPDDYEILFNQRSRVVDAIVKGVLKAFNLSEPVLSNSQCEIDLAEQRKQVSNLQEQVNGLLKDIDSLKGELSAEKEKSGTASGRIQELTTQNNNMSTEMGHLRTEIKALTGVVESKTQAIDLLSKEDVVQLETLKRAEDKADLYSDKYFNVILTIREQLKLSSEVSIDEAAESEAYNAIQSLRQTNETLQAQVKSLEAEVKKLSVYKQPVAKLTTKQMFAVILEKLLGTSNK